MSKQLSSLVTGSLRNKEPKESKCNPVHKVVQSSLMKKSVYGTGTTQKPLHSIVGKQMKMDSKSTVHKLVQSSLLRKSGNGNQATKKILPSSVEKQSVNSRIPRLSKMPLKEQNVEPKVTKQSTPKVPKFDRPSNHMSPAFPSDISCIEPVFKESPMPSAAPNKKPLIRSLTIEKSNGIQIQAKEKENVKNKKLVPQISKNKPIFKSNSKFTALAPSISNPAKQQKACPTTKTKVQRLQGTELTSNDKSSAIKSKSSLLTMKKQNITSKKISSTVSALKNPISTVRKSYLTKPAFIKSHSMPLTTKKSNPTSVVTKKLDTASSSINLVSSVTTDATSTTLPLMKHDNINANKDLSKFENNKESNPTEQLKFIKEIEEPKTTEQLKLIEEIEQPEPLSCILGTASEECFSGQIPTTPLNRNVCPAAFTRLSIHGSLKKNKLKFTYGPTSLKKAKHFSKSFLEVSLLENEMLPYIPCLDELDNTYLTVIAQDNEGEDSALSDDIFIEGEIVEIPKYPPPFPENFNFNRLTIHASLRKQKPTLKYSKKRLFSKSFSDISFLEDQQLPKVECLDDLEDNSLYITCKNELTNQILTPLMSNIKGSCSSLCKKFSRLRLNSAPQTPVHLPVIEDNQSSPFTVSLLGSFQTPVRLAEISQNLIKFSS